MIKHWVRDLIAVWRGHPSERQLLAFHDSELLGKHRRRIMQHLNQCPECQDKSDQIDRDWKHLTEMTATVEADPVISEEELIARIQNSIHEWSSIHPADSGPAQVSEPAPEIPFRPESSGIRSVLRILRGRKRA